MSLINVNEIVFAIPGDIRTLTGGYIYDFRVAAKLREIGIGVQHIELPASFPFPSGSDLSRAADLLQGVSGPLMIDGLAYSALPLAILQNLARPLIALIHHPLGLESGLPPEVAGQFLNQERAALRLADHIIVTSRTSAETLETEFEVQASRITVAEPGTNPAKRHAGSQSSADEGPCILAAGAMVPRKGYNFLLDALSQCRDLNWRLHIAGSPYRDPDTAAALMRQRENLDLCRQVEMKGELMPDELDKAYDEADIFVLASLYEGYGMVLAEAMARGLPIITTTGGAAAATVPSGAALNVPSGNAGALAEALRKMILDVDLRRRISQASWLAGQSLPNWRSTARKISAAISRL